MLLSVARRSARLLPLIFCAAALVLFASPRSSLASGSGLLWSTFVGGGSADNAYGVAVDKNGDIYVVGSTGSTDYPVTSGAYQNIKAAGTDAFVTKLRGDGTGIVWSTYLGGGQTDEARAVAIDGNGNVYVTGNTSSTDFPTTSSAYHRSSAGGIDAFIVKLSPTTGNVSYSTLFGGSWDDYPRGIAVDGSGQVVVGGFTSSSDLPTTSGVVKATRTPVFPDGADGFLVKMNAQGSSVMFATYLGTDGGTDEIFGVALDSSGRPTVTGWTLSPSFPTTASAYDRSWAAEREGFVTQLNATATGYVYSTFLGASGRDEPFAIALDGQGAVYIAGRTASTNFPTTATAYQTSFGGGTSDMFLSKLSPAGDALSYSTYIGGSGTDAAYWLAVTSTGEVCLTGSSDGAFPVTIGSFDTSQNGAADLCAVRVSPGAATSVASLAYSTFVGSAGTDIGQAVAIAPSGNIVLAGYSDNGGYPTSPGAYDTSQNGSGSNDCVVTSMNIGLSSVTSVDDRDPVDPAVTGATLLAPSPFSTRLSIRYVQGPDGPAAIRIFDIQGRVVRSLSDPLSSSGTHTVVWDGRDAAGRQAPSGSYRIELTSPARREVLKAIKL